MFRFCEDIEETKKLYRMLSFKLHPDYGGDSYLMSILTKAYEAEIEHIKSGKKRNDEKRRDKYPMTHEEVCAGDGRLELLSDVMEYGLHHKRFDLSFCESVAEFLDENGYITSQQYNALRRVYHSFRMEEWLKTKRGE